jgi:hypothetical protein
MKAQILLLSIVLLLNSCSSDDEGFTPTLPAISQTGSNTFGCFIDGVLLTPRDGSGSFNVEDKGMIMISGPSLLPYKELRVRDFVSGTGALLDIHFDNLDNNGEGIFPILESNCQNGIDANPTINVRVRIWDSNQEVFKWYCSAENAGNLTITRYDFDNLIVSGIFSCTVQNRDNPDDRIEITEGRFDLDRATLPNTNFQ